MMETIDLNLNRYHVLRSVTDALNDDEIYKRFADYLTSERGQRFREAVQLFLGNADCDSCSKRRRAHVHRVHANYQHWKTTYSLLDVANNHLVDGTHRAAIRFALMMPMRIKLVRLIEKEEMTNAT